MREGWAEAGSRVIFIVKMITLLISEKEGSGSRDSIYISLRYFRVCGTLIYSHKDSFICSFPTNPETDPESVRSSLSSAIREWLTSLEKFFPPVWKVEKAMAPRSSTLAWKIPRTEEPGRLQSMGSWRVRHDWATSLFIFTHWRWKWQPTPVFLPGESQWWGSLVGCLLQGDTESDTTEAT